MTSLLWVGFVVFVVVMLFVDLAVLNRGSREIRAREALAWTAVCVTLALVFNVLVYFMYEHHWLGIGLRPEGSTEPVLGGRTAALQFFAGWLVEYSLSVDNIFVIAIIFSYFRVPLGYQHRVLFWGILGALVMRGAMIAAGTTLIEHFHWTIYVFAAILLATAVRLLLTTEDKLDPERGVVLRLARRFLPVSPGLDGQRFFTRVEGRFAVTPLFLVLLVVETTDVVFAVDSIPAIIGITRDPFLVFTSNVFAVLGLRSLYFALAAFMDKFRYLKLSLVFVLGFVAIKMFLDGLGVHIKIEVSLGVIAVLLAGGVGASLLVSGREKREAEAPITELAWAAEAAWKRARRTIILVIGITILLLSIPIGLLPGPGGIAVAIGGLALLATEFVWARNVLKSVKMRAQGIVPASPRLWIIPVLWTVLLGAIMAASAAVPEHSHLVLYGSVGPVLALLLWSVAVIRRWRYVRSAAGTGQHPPGTAVPPATTAAPVDPRPPHRTGPAASPPAAS
ncbi:MAG: TerC/Alx family metal homeostasis membrane protein [Phycisphaerales bacterium]